MRVNRLLPGLAACLALSSVLAYWQLHRAPAASSGTEPVAETAPQGRAGIPATALGAGGLTQWQFLGPNNVGGPTSFVGYHPDNASIVYAVTHGGDVFRSDDAAGTWAFQGHVPLRGAKLEIASGQSQTLYAYADSPQAQAQVSGGNSFVLLFKSIDGGRTWAELRPQDIYQAAWLGQQVHRVRTIPGQPGVLWATTWYGLIRSTDDGASWNLMYTQGGGTLCNDLEISVANARAYTVCTTPAWNVISAKLDGSGWSQLTQRTGTDSQTARLAMAKGNPNVIYLATFGDGLAPNPSSYQVSYLGSIIRTTDAGATWQTRYDRAQQTDIVSAAIPGDVDLECEAPEYGALTPGPNDMVVDPANSALLWIAGFEIYRSNDGGASFGRVRARAERVDDPSLGIYQGLTGNLRYSTLAFPPNYNGTTVQTVLAGGRTGIERTDSARATAQTASNVTCATIGTAPAPAMAWSARNNGYSATRFVHGEMLESGELIASGPDLDVGLSDGSGPDSWASITPLKAWVVGQVSIDPTLGTDRFTVGVSTGAINWAWDTAQSKWKANQASFFTLNAYPPGYVLPWEDEVYRTWDYPRLARDPKNRVRLIAATPDGVFESQTNGDSWVLISPNMPVVAVSFKRDGTILAGTGDGFILAQLAPGMQQWEKRDLSGCVLVQGHSCIGASAHITEFVRSPNPTDNGIYATAEGFGEAKVWYSANGSAWQPLDKPGQAGGLPDYIGSTTLAIDADNPRHLYAGTPVGLFASEDNGGSWVEVENPFPGTPVAKLQFQKDPVKGTRKLVAFTYGRGAWVANVAMSTTFSDVPTYYWANGFIQKLYVAGITGGCATNPLRYCPTQTVQRDQMAVFLLRAKHGKTYQPPAASGDFSDVPTTHWAAAWIERLRDEGITGGCGTNPLRYCPANPVRREEIAVFLLRAKHGASYQPPAATGMYGDVPTNYWAAAWIEQLSREGIAGGCSTAPKNYCPNSPVTRDQMAAFLVRTFAL